MKSAILSFALGCILTAAALYVLQFRSVEAPDLARVQAQRMPVGVGPDGQRAGGEMGSIRGFLVVPA